MGEDPPATCENTFEYQANLFAGVKSLNALNLAAATGVPGLDVINPTRKRSVTGANARLRLLLVSSKRVR